MFVAAEQLIYGKNKFNIKIIFKSLVSPKSFFLQLKIVALLKKKSHKMTSEAVFRDTIA